MEFEPAAAALEREHHEIDAAIEAFASGPAARDRDPQPLREAIRALRRHIYIEEEFLFPGLRESGLIAAIFVMLREHAQLWTTLEALDRELDTGASTGAALMLCHQLTVQLQHHNLKEEKIIYPAADQMLTAPATAQLRALLATGGLPEGWACHNVRGAGQAC
jgi:regulator of cell morphogenesis and NO signaling